MFEKKNTYRMLHLPFTLRKFNHNVCLEHPFYCQTLNSADCVSQNKRTNQIKVSQQNMIWASHFLKNNYGYFGQFLNYVTTENDEIFKQDFIPKFNVKK